MTADAGIAVGTDPDALWLAALGAGLEVRAPGRSRVLDLGSRGTGAVALAFHLPGSEVVAVGTAVDLAEARQGKAALDLGNLTLCETDSLDALDTTVVDGVFDYVMVRRPLTTMGPGARDRVLAACATRADLNGVVGVVFDTLPAGAARRWLAEAVDRACSGTADAEARLSRTHAVLTAWGQSLPAGSADPGVLRALQQELAALAMDPSAVRNLALGGRTALGPDEVYAMARAHGLDAVAVVTETADGTALRTRLREGTRDPDELEAWVDLVSGRTERALALYHRDAPRREAPTSAECVQRCWLSAAAVAQSRRPSLADGAEELFDLGGVTVSSRQAIFKTALVVLGRMYPGAMRLEALEVSARKLMDSAGMPAVDEHLRDAEMVALTGDLAELHAAGLLGVHARERAVTAAVTETPRVSLLTRWEASRGPSVTTVGLGTTDIDGLARYVALQLDGTRNADAVVESVIRAVAEGVVTLARDGRTLPREALADLVPGLVGERVLAFARLGLLVEDGP